MNNAVHELWQHAPTLTGRHVSLVPLSRTHVDGLRTARDHAGLDGLWFTNTPSVDGMEQFVERALQVQAGGDAQPFAVLDAAGEVVGSTRFYAFDPVLPRVNIGYTWYAPRAQRTAVNTEAKLLLLGHAFETLGCAAVGFETSSHNGRSRTAITRLGARQDGVLRHHRRHADGSLRDTVVFSIIDREWPEAKAGLLAKLQQHESN